ncbi:MAG TPA: hypothetical protein VK171_10090 [Fimbriimonas sp.]|nr:hypothetical protein [Fimbriimonas sp.]
MFRPEILVFLIPIIALFIPIVRTLVQHQQKMAEIVHGNNSVNPQALAETNQMREEIRQLREMMNQQTIAIDNLRDEFRGRSNIEQRLSDQS